MKLNFRVQNMNMIAFLRNMDVSACLFDFLRSDKKNSSLALTA